MDATTRADSSRRDSDASASDAPLCEGGVRVADDPFEARREACEFAAGASAEQTLGVDDATRANLPLRHVLIVMQENRSFDHYFGALADYAEVERWPADYANPDRTGARVSPQHLASTCLPADPPHQWDAMHTGWNRGAMDGFVRSAAVNGSDGHYALGYYNESDLPFYYWMARTWALADHHFASALGGTWANRLYLYAGTSEGVRNTGERVVTDLRTVFDQLDDAGVSWGVYTNGNPRQDCMGWTRTHRGVHLFPELLQSLADGTLPRVVFVDPGPAEDEHPPNNVQLGEAWTRSLYLSVLRSPLWPSLAMVFTYDEAGGLADHLAPPVGCVAAPGEEDFAQRGIRVPLMVVSPWARRGYVSHRVHDHSSILRLVQVLHGLPALTGRDANADALLDLFDFTCPNLALPATPPPAGTDGCR